MEHGESIDFKDLLSLNLDIVEEHRPEQVDSEDLEGVDNQAILDIIDVGMNLLVDNLLPDYHSVVMEHLY